MMKIIKPKTILISRTDSIGDVVLTLPICTWIKQQFPDCKIIFLGNAYTKPVLEKFSILDEVIEWETIKESPEKLLSFDIDTCIHVFPRKEIARLVKRIKIKHRIGTSHRLFHLLTCNYRLNFTRKNARIHEAQLNFELLKPLGLHEIPSLDSVKEMYSPFQVQKPINYTETHPAQIILHPKSKGSAIEWPIEKYITLAEELSAKNCTIYFTGTENEGNMFRHLIPAKPNIIDLTGKLTLSEFMVFMNQCDAIVGCSTGPLHLAAIMGLRTVGIFSRTRPVHPGRWQPLGDKVNIITHTDEAEKGTIHPEFVQKIEVSEILQTLNNNLDLR